jgi:hypothetical protein
MTPAGRRITVEHRGKPYLVELDEATAAAPRWVVTLGPTAITSLDARPGDDEAAVRVRLLAWLDHQPPLDSRDDVHLGGG